MWTYNYTDELYHYGVPGMKWGQRKKAEKLYKKVGKQRGIGDYWKDQGTESARKYKSAAAILEAKAKQYEAKGKVVKAEASRQAAKKLNVKAADARRKYDETALQYYNKASRIEDKVSKYATKKRVDIGKDRVDSILKSSKLKSYNETKSWEDSKKMAKYKNMVNSFRNGNASTNSSVSMYDYI